MDNSLLDDSDTYLAERVRDIAESIVDTTTIEGKTLLRAAERLVLYSAALRKVAELPCLLDCDISDSRLYVDGDDCASCFAGIVIGGTS